MIWNLRETNIYSVISMGSYRTKSKFCKWYHTLKEEKSICLVNDMISLMNHTIYFLESKNTLRKWYGIFRNNKYA